MALDTGDFIRLFPFIAKCCKHQIVCVHGICIENVCIKTLQDPFVKFRSDGFVLIIPVNND